MSKDITFEEIVQELDRLTKQTPKGWTSREFREEWEKTTGQPLEEHRSRYLIKDLIEEGLVVSGGRAKRPTMVGGEYTSVPVYQFVDKGKRGKK